jgi:hypothetical protein
MEIDWVRVRQLHWQTYTALVQGFERGEPAMSMATLAEAHGVLAALLEATDGEVEAAVVLRALERAERALAEASRRHR